MAQSFTTTSTQIIDAQNNTASIDTLSQQLQVREPTVQDILQRQTDLMQNINDYLESLLQPKTSSAASIPINVPSDNSISTSIPNTFLFGSINIYNGGFRFGQYIEMNTNGKSKVIAYFTNGYWQENVYGSIDGITWRTITSGISQLGGLYLAGGGVIINSTSATCILCSGYQKIRIAYTVNNTAVDLKATLVSSYGSLNFFFNAMNYTSTSYWINNILATSYLVPKIGISGIVVTNTYININAIRNIGSTTSTTQSLYGITTYNPNDFPIYLLMWNYSGSPVTFNNSSQSVSWTLMIPPGCFTFALSFFVPYMTGSPYYLLVAASMSNSTYIPVPLGVNITTHTRV